jgi:hypothetical protein
VRRAGKLALAGLSAVAVCVIVTSVVFVVRQRDAAAALHSFRMSEVVPLYHGRYDPAGYYVGPLLSPLASPNRRLARNGLPVVDYPGVGYRVNPYIIEEYGLWAYGESLRGVRSDRRIVVRAADWLVAHQHSGRWWYSFPFARDGWTMKPPWYSSLAQAGGMSLLERAYRLTGRRVYFEAALHALVAFGRPVGDGGVRSCFQGDCELGFYEEYPYRPAVHVVNGFMFTLIGLYDLASIAPRSAAMTDYLAGRRTLARALPLYDVGGRPSYDLSQDVLAGAKANLNADYYPVVVFLLRALNSLTPNPEFRAYAARWLRAI